MNHSFRSVSVSGPAAIIFERNSISAHPATSSGRSSKCVRIKINFFGHGRRHKKTHNQWMDHTPCDVWRWNALIFRHDDDAIYRQSLPANQKISKKIKTFLKKNPIKSENTRRAELTNLHIPATLLSTGCSPAFLTAHLSIFRRWKKKAKGRDDARYDCQSRPSVQHDPRWLILNQINQIKLPALFVYREKCHVTWNP